MLVHVNGCTDTNSGFDGISYQPVWPDGNTALHPEPLLFSSPRTGRHYDVQYSRTAFEADLPRIKAGCNRTTGAGCTLIPTTDAGTPVALYPFFSAFQDRFQSRSRSLSRHEPENHGCQWTFGGHLRGANDFGRNAQYGTLLSNPYLVFGGGGSFANIINDYRQVMPNPCPAAGPEHGHHR